MCTNSCMRWCRPLKMPLETRQQKHYYIIFYFIKLWTHTSDQLNEFKTLINSINNDIQFKMEYSQDQLQFLDILIIKKAETLKLASRKKKILNNSWYSIGSHTKHTKNNIPFYLMRRFCTIVSNYETRNKKIKKKSKN